MKDYTSCICSTVFAGIYEIIDSEKLNNSLNSYSNLSRRKFFVVRILDAPNLGIRFIVKICLLLSHSNDVFLDV